MPDIYFTDEIKIVDIDKDSWGVETVTDGDAIPARIEDYNQLITGINGQDVIANMLVMINKNITLKYTDKIKINKKAGVDYEMPDKMFLIKKISKMAMFGRQYIEIYI